MAMRYSVFNPDGEEVQTPSEANANEVGMTLLRDQLARGQMNDSRAAEVRMALLRDQLGRGGGGDLSGGGGGYAQRGGGPGAFGGDPFFADKAQGASLQDELEAKKEMLREKVAGDMAIQGQRGAQDYRLADLGDRGATERAHIGNEIGLANNRLDTTKYTDLQPAVQAKAAEEAAQANYQTGIYGRLGSGEQPTDRDLVAIGRDPRMLRDPLAEEKMQMDMAQAEKLAQADPNNANAIYSLARAGRIGEYKQTPRVDQASINEAGQVMKLPEIQRHIAGLADYISSVSGWWSDANKQFVQERISRVAQALHNTGVSPQAYRLAMEEVKGIIRNALDAESWDAVGADDVRGMIGDQATGGGKFQGALNIAGAAAAGPAYLAAAGYNRLTR